MTTVAVNREAMASDSQCTDSGAKIKVTKMWRIRNDILGICGNLTYGLNFVAWYRAGADLDDPPELGEEFEAVVLTGSGRILSHDSSLRAIPILDPFYAIGSGKHAALGALYSGATPREAVKVACKIDPYSRGTVKEFKL